MMFSHERHCGTRGELGGRADYSRVHPENSALRLGDTTALIFWTARARPDGYTIDFGSLSTHLLNGAARHAEARHPSRERADDAPVPPRRKRGIRKVHNASGFPDVIVDDPRAARLLRDQDKGSPTIERNSLSRGYEESGEAIGEDEDIDA